MKEPATLDTVLKTVQSGFAAVAEDIADIKATMATKDDLAAVKKELKGNIADLRTELKGNIAELKTELKADIAKLGTQVASIERELKTIRRDLEDLREKLENVTEYRKEIDHAFARIAAIERHLGLKPPKPAAQ
jgi:septal ring factor EnvC (AmiA/AmiB activator)